MFIIGFPNLMWDIYILGPINLVQQTNLKYKPDKTMKIVNKAFADDSNK